MTLNTAQLQAKHYSKVDQVTVKEESPLICITPALIAPTLIKVERSMLKELLSDRENAPPLVIELTSICTLREKKLPYSRKCSFECSYLKNM